MITFKKMALGAKGFHEVDGDLWMHTVCLCGFDHSDSGGIRFRIEPEVQAQLEDDWGRSGVAGDLIVKVEDESPSFMDFLMGTADEDWEPRVGFIGVHEFEEEPSEDTENKGVARFRDFDEFLDVVEVPLREAIPDVDLISIFP